MKRLLPILMLLTGCATTAAVNTEYHQTQMRPYITGQKITNPFDKPIYVRVECPSIVPRLGNLFLIMSPGKTIGLRQDGCRVENWEIDPPNDDRVKVEP